MRSYLAFCFAVQEEKAMAAVPQYPIEASKFVAYVLERKKKRILFKGELMVSVLEWAMGCVFSSRWYLRCRLSMPILISILHRTDGAGSKIQSTPMRSCVRF